MRRAQSTAGEDFDYAHLMSGQKEFVLTEMMFDHRQRFGPGLGLGVTLEAARWQRAFQRGLHHVVLGALAQIVDARYQPAQEGKGAFTRTWRWKHGERIRFVRASLPLVRSGALTRNAMRNPDVVTYELRSDIIAGLLAGRRVVGDGLWAAGFSVGDLADEEDGFARLLGIQARIQRRDDIRGRIFELMGTIRGGLPRPVSPLAVGRLPIDLFSAICPQPGEERELAT